VFFFGGCVVGPFFEYSDYKNWIELTGHYSDLPKGFATLRPALIRFINALMCISIYVALSSVLGFPISFCGDKEFITYRSEAFRIFYYNVAMTG